MNRHIFVLNITKIVTIFELALLVKGCFTENCKKQYSTKYVHVHNYNSSLFYSNVNLTQYTFTISLFLTEMSFSIIGFLIFFVSCCLLLNRKYIKPLTNSNPFCGNLFCDKDNRHIFIVYVDADLDKFYLLNETLEGRLNKTNSKYLGGRTYKTLYHERDFIPGDLITENIERCVNKCNCTLILLTPAFLKSDWCREEFKIADRKRKAIFIKVVADEKQEQELYNLLSLKENAPMKRHLNNITYLKWNGKENDEDFWKWLFYILPPNKKKHHIYNC